MSKIVEPETDQLLWESLEKKDTGILKWNEIQDRSKLTDYQNKMLDLYEGSTSRMIPIEEGQIVEGVIENISRKEVVINVDYKDFIYVENTSTDWKFVKNLQIGDNIKVLIVGVSYKPSYKIKGSISELMRMDVERRIKTFYKDKLPIDAKAISKNSAGFMVKLEISGIEIDAFMPNTIAAPNKLTSEQAEELIGKEFKVCLETLREDKGLYVVSRKKYLREHLFKEEIQKINMEGAVYKGIITGTTPFGVFVEFAVSDDVPRCLTGMIHKVNLHPENNIKDLRPGMEIEFFVKDIVKKGKEIVLTQVLRESLWDTIRVGKVFEGKVVNVKHFGSLIQLDEETFGVIQTTYLKRANRKLSVGEKVWVKIISFLKDDRKIYLDFAEEN